MSTTSSGVTARDVQLELGDTDGELDPELIQYHLMRADAYVTSRAASWASQSDIQDAVAVEAAYRLVAKNKAAYVRMREAAELRKDWDVDSFIEMLEKDRDEKIADVTGNSGPRMRTLGGRTHPDDHTHYNG